MFGPQLFNLQKKQQTDDGIGGFSETWKDYEPLEGYIDLVTGTNLSTVQNAFIEDSTHILTVPAYPSFATTIDDKMRIVDSNNRFYNITYVDDPVGQHHHLEIYLSFGGVVNGN